MNQLFQAERFLIETGFPPESVAPLTETGRKILQDEKKKELIESALALYEEAPNGAPDWRALEKVYLSFREETGEDAYGELLMFFVFLAPALREAYRKAGLPEEIFRDTMRDLRYKAIECKAVYDVWGTFVSSWFIGFFALIRFEIGRFQYEMSTFSSEGSPFDGRRGLGIHIPSSGPLRKEEMEESFRRAAAFFESRIPGDEILFMTDTWLLYPPLQEALPEGSGIRLFGDYFTVVSSTEHRNDYWRVFDTFDVSDPDRLKNGTFLQRLYVSWLKEGKPNGNGTGYFLMDKKTKEILPKE